MIDFLSNWTKSIGVTIVIVSILEMILPNNKTKKYIRMILGIFVIFNIISPLIQNKEELNFNNFNIENYTSIETATTVNQSSMDERINKLYEKELEKNITERLEEIGYKIKNIVVRTDRNEEEWEISKIQINIKREENEVTREDIMNVKRILIEEYGVNDKCLKIN